MADQAEKFETQWSPTLAELANNFDIADFDDLVALRNQLAHGLGPATIQLEKVRKQFRAQLDPALHEQFVRISEVATRWATLDIIAPSLSESLTQVHLAQAKQLNDVFEKVAEPLRRTIAEFSRPLQEAVTRLAVDALLPRNAGLAVGDLALLRVEHSEGISFVSLLAAVGDAIEDVALDAATSAYFSDEPLPSDVQADIELRRSAGETVTVPPSVVVLAS
ncbi:MAG: hypothetical protein HYR89_06555 [Actinobacteria bacterium]|nr:hypothetical protein [Actinomycetota bacterium]